MKKQIIISYRLLYFTYGLIPIIAGFDKYFQILADWSIYLNPSIPQHLHMSPSTFMYSVGGIEILMGFLVFFQPRIGGYVVSAWLMLISINLISMGVHQHPGHVHAMVHYDTAIRDLAMAVGAFVLALLSQACDDKAENNAV